MLCLVVFLPQAKPPDVQFAGVAYFHRYSKDNLHEYTPRGQQDLNKWTDMLTINDYPQAKDGEALAGVANNVLAAYKGAGGEILKTSSVPRTATSPAEHLIVVLFVRQDFVEVAFARFMLRDGVGMSLVSSHRAYGKSAKKTLGDWLKAWGEKREKALMAHKDLPKRP